MRRFEHDNRILKIVALALCLVMMAAAAPLAATVHAASGYEKVAGITSTAGEVGKYGMTPIRGIDVKDGRHTIKVDSSSKFFRVSKATLTVKDGKMSAVILIDSTSYECIYLGVGTQAAQAPKADYIYPKVKDGQSWFTIPVEALDMAIDCAAFSKKKSMWYDRKILFDATSLQAGVLKIQLPDYDLIDEAVKNYDEKNGTDSAGSSGVQQMGSAEPAKVSREDGTDSIEVNMTGGSGRASVSSPTWLIVKNHKAYARLLWSSSHYDYMIVGGKKYVNEATDGGNSTFTIPITVFDKPFNVIADTTAMGDPLEITYQLTFYRSTIASKNQVPQEAAKKVIGIALVIIVAGGVLNWIVKRRKKN